MMHLCLIWDQEEANNGHMKVKLPVAVPWKPHKASFTLNPTLIPFHLYIPVGHHTLSHKRGFYIGEKIF